MSTVRPRSATSLVSRCASSNSSRASVSEYGVSRYLPRSRPITFVYHRLNPRTPAPPGHPRIFPAPRRVTRGLGGHVVGWLVRLHPLLDSQFAHGAPDD